MTLWSGRTGTPLDPAVDRFLRADDTELLPYDIQGTLLHADRLHAAGLLTDQELKDVTNRLQSMSAAAIRDDDEDVHSAIERHLGDAGRKIHAGRSRNDQVATAMRLFVTDACDNAVRDIRALALTILDRAEQHADSPMPGYTHLQRAIPVTLGYHLLAWNEMLERDRGRFATALSHAAPMPLGAASLAGSTLGLPAAPNPMHNTIDAVSDRDFALDYLYSAAVFFTHLSRMAEEIILWTTSEFGFARLPENAATGSSMMPQKLNPDPAELARGKAGTAIGRLTGLLATVKSLPLAYDRDLQEDKPPVFATRRDVEGALASLRVLIAGLDFDTQRMREACSDPLLHATDAAERLVKEGIAFRDAHEQVARSVQEGNFKAQASDGGLKARGIDIARDIAQARERWNA